MNTYFEIEKPTNEPIIDYNKNSEERTELSRTIREIGNSITEVPAIINGKEIKTNNTFTVSCPHNHKKIIATGHIANKELVERAIHSAQEAKQQWSTTSFQDRVAILLKVAELLSKKYRFHINAATMLEQSKTVHEAEIDATCRTIDLIRFNVYNAYNILKSQPQSGKNEINSFEYLPLEGFIFTLSSFHSTSTASNLNLAPILMGNTTIWNPSDKSLLSSYFLMKVFKEAGLPNGVINFLPGQTQETRNLLLASSSLGGIHFSGSTDQHNALWKHVSNNMEKYKSFPKVVGESKNKSYIFAHNTADINELTTALIRGAFEFQGQKNKSTSSAYIPLSIWGKLKHSLSQNVGKIKVGDIETFTNFMNAVIDEITFDEICGYIERAKNSDLCEILFEGTYDKTKGYFISPTIIITTNPHYETLAVDIWGPILTILLYEDSDFEKTLEICAKTSNQTQAGSFFSSDRYAIIKASELLKFSTGNLYINDKPSEHIGLDWNNGNLKHRFNLLHWIKSRSIHENLVPPKDFTYPFMEYIEYYL